MPSRQESKKLLQKAICPRCGEAYLVRHRARQITCHECNVRFDVGSRNVDSNWFRRLLQSITGRPRRTHNSGHRHTSLR